MCALPPPGFLMCFLMNVVGEIRTLLRTYNMCMCHMYVFVCVFVNWQVGRPVTYSVKDRGGGGGGGRRRWGIPYLLFLVVYLIIQKEI
jgi:hypothetical protein